jgi:hypothetical protein
MGLFPPGEKRLFGQEDFLMWGKWGKVFLLAVWVLGAAWMGCGGSPGPAKVTPEEEKQLQKQLEEAAAAEGRAGWGKPEAQPAPAPKK